MLIRSTNVLIYMPLSLSLALFHYLYYFPQGLILVVCELSMLLLLLLMIALLITIGCFPAHADFNCFLHWYNIKACTRTYTFEDFAAS